MVEKMATTETPSVKKLSYEAITPHKITIAILVRSYCLFRDTYDFKRVIDETRRAKYRRDFSVLTLKLLQSPDLSLEQLRNILVSNKYKVHMNVVRTFDDTLLNVYKNGTGALLDIIESMNRIMPPIENMSPGTTDVTAESFVSRISIVGFYLRRVIVNFDVLTFSEVTNVYLTFQKYYEDWKKTIPNKNQHPSDSDSKISCPDDWSANRDQWSRRQAELFIATQAALLTSNPEKALSPKDIHSRIRNLLKSNPKLSQAHFLSYLNYLRVGEFCSAMESLYHCFDRKAFADTKGATTEEKSKIYRFATLNLAILHYHFGHKEEALVCLKQAISTSQAASDDTCLQHSLSWLYKLTNVNKEQLIEQLVSTSYKMDMPYIGSLGVQTFVQHACTISGNPVRMFENLTKSDVVNSHHNMFDLISSSFSIRSAMWQNYGKSELSLLWSQLALYLNVDSSTQGNSKKFYSEGFCLAVCNIANQLLQSGNYNLVNTILEYTKERFPHPPNANHWKFSENLAIYTKALHNENWNVAESAAQKIAVLDQDEGHLRLGELYFYKQDYLEAHRYIDLILKRFKDGHEDQLKMMHYIRAKILLAEVQFAGYSPEKVPPGVVTLLSDCLIEADKYHLEYFAAMARLHIAHVQLSLGLTGQALRLLDRCLIQILAHGGNFDRARAMLLYVKCRVAHADRLEGDEKRAEILSCAEILEKVKEDFRVVDAFSRIKDALFFQANLYNSLNMKTERNNCALEFRLLEEDRTTKNYSTFSKYL